MLVFSAEFGGKGVSFFLRLLMLPLVWLAVCAGEKKPPVINSELWHACAGPLVSLPPAGSLVVYFPQGHSEQVDPSSHSLSLSVLASAVILGSFVLFAIFLMSFFRVVGLVHVQ
jgi:hypothetical protein